MDDVRRMFEAADAHGRGYARRVAELVYELTGVSVTADLVRVWRSNLEVPRWVEVKLDVITARLGEVRCE